MVASNKPTAIEEALGKDLVITRVFDAPRDVVWKAWTDPGEMAKWWGPHGFTTPVCKMDVRPGGAIELHMQGPEGPAMPMGGKFLEVNPPEKLVFTTFAFENEKGEYGLENLNTVVFKEEGGKTKMTLTAKLVKARHEFEQAIKGMKAGWNQSLDRLFAVTTGNKEFVITRVFEAPRELLWEVYSKAEHLAKWWGPQGLKMAELKLDFRPGGLFHYCMETPDGFKMWGRFVYQEIDAPERVSFIVSFSDEAGGITSHPMSPTWPKEVLSVVTFFEVAPGKTALIMSGVPVNATEEEKKTFDAGRSSMDQGFKGTLDQLEAYLAEVQK